MFNFLEMKCVVFNVKFEHFFVNFVWVKLASIDLRQTKVFQ